MDPDNGRPDPIEAKLDNISERVEIMESVGEGLKLVSRSVDNLMGNLELAVIAQQESEANRAAESEQSRRRFFVTIAGIVLANIVVIAISIAVLLNQQDAREVSDARAIANRDRQSCATTLMVEWDARLGEALRLTTQIPRVDPESPQYRDAIENLNRATSLLNHAGELCYGPVPNPSPVPNR